MLYRRWPTTADVLQGLALDSDSDMKPSDTVELAEFLPNESNSESNGVKGEATDQQSASTGWQILMKSFCLQNYAPLQKYKMTTVLLPRQPQFNSVPRKE